MLRCVCLEVLEEIHRARDGLAERLDRLAEKAGVLKAPEEEEGSDETMLGAVRIGTWTSPRNLRSTAGEKL